MYDIFILVVLIFGMGAFYFAPWVPTKTKDVERIYQILQPTSADVFYDLGCGDGRLDFYFAQKGIKAVGFEISIIFYLYCICKKWLTRSKNIDFVFGNFFKKNLAEATIVYMFGTDASINKSNAFKTKLQSELKPGTKIVSYLFKIDWLEQISVHKDPKGMSIYVYKI